MRILTGVALTVAAVHLFPVSSKGQGNRPAVSAYEGNVGDWALGQWDGYVFPNYGNTAMQQDPRVLIVQRRPDGKVGCRWARPDKLTNVGWAPRCQITASSLTLLTTVNTEVELDRVGANLEGRMTGRGSTRFRAYLKRSH